MFYAIGVRFVPPSIVLHEYIILTKFEVNRPGLFVCAGPSEQYACTRRHRFSSPGALSGGGGNSFTLFLFFTHFWYNCNVDFLVV